MARKKTDPQAPNVEKAIVLPGPALHCAEQVFQWMLGGLTEHQVLTNIRETWPGIDAQPLICHAAGRLLDSAKADPQMVRGWCFEATRALYQKALDAEDLELALKAVKQLAILARV